MVLSSKRSNRLASEASAYLRQHAHNPVEWFPWGAEALAKAKADGKPIMLSIGYSACHWCHVMERESFDDEATAALLNEHFVCIKVDREERPDIDQLYQPVVQLLRQSGGWPLTVFLTPEQKPFFAGTYFPKEARSGVRSFQQILTAVRDGYASQREDVELQADEITSTIAQATSARGDAQGRYQPGPDLLSLAARFLSARFDEEHGGFGGRPKFPSSMAVELLLRKAALERDGDAEARVRLALDGMRAGGIWDHLGGGFHRYSTDERWLVPHFEKMLYDNALLARLYADASRALSSSSYAEVASDIATYLLREMQSPSGAFFAAQDADSEGEEGKFFVWRPEEIDHVLADPLEREVAKLHFGVTPEGNFASTGASVLFESMSAGRISIKLSRAPSEIDAVLARAKEALFAAREARPRPFCDQKLLASWNGLVISALAELGGASGTHQLVEAAERAFADLRSSLIDEEGRVGRFKTVEQGTEHIKAPGFLDDHANMAIAALDLYEVTSRPAYAELACSIAEQILARFHDPETGDFFFTPKDADPLIHRTHDPYDQSTPSSAAMAVMALLRLGTLLGDRYAKPAERYLRELASSAIENPFGFGQTLCALDRLVRGSVDVVIVGELSDARTIALRQTALEAYLPNRTLAVISPSSEASRKVAAALAEGKLSGSETAPVAYVCRDRTCSAPVRTASQLSSLLRH